MIKKMNKYNTKMDRAIYKLKYGEGYDSPVQCRTCFYGDVQVCQHPACTDENQFFNEASIKYCWTAKIKE